MFERFKQDNSAEFSPRSALKTRCFYTPTRRTRHLSRVSLLFFSDKCNNVLFPVMSESIFDCCFLLIIQGKKAHCFWRERREHGGEKQWKIELEKRDGIKRDAGGERDWWHRQRRREMILGTQSDFSPGEAREPAAANTCRFLFSMHLLSAPCFILASYNGAVNNSWQVSSSRRPTTP